MDSYFSWNQVEVKNVLMTNVFLINTVFLFTGLVDGFWWTGVVWILQCFYQLFGLSFWRHPFTAEDPFLSKWCNATFAQIPMFPWRNKLWGCIYFTMIYCNLMITKVANLYYQMKTYCKVLTNFPGLSGDILSWFSFLTTLLWYNHGQRGGKEKYKTNNITMCFSQYNQIYVNTKANNNYYINSHFISFLRNTLKKLLWMQFHDIVNQLSSI